MGTNLELKSRPEQSPGLASIPSLCPRLAQHLASTPPAALPVQCSLRHNERHLLPLQSRPAWEVLTFRVQERDDAQLTLSHIERVLQVVSGVGVLQLIKVNQVGPGDEARLSVGSGGHSIPIHSAAPAGCNVGRWLGRRSERR